ncbi:hypothetical protein GM658_21090 [Pseudoduganella eburnea]|uniref:DUF4034 domain-containing protein n=1 Tax=Massilia eburnea TaxID=1776165 RepID=A0A6L6QMH4_9BURK|nr:hypothetical protein [Massilia eburnea]MTW13107.1 hypothetical protein [Massilia eburnea]
MLLSLLLTIAPVEPAGGSAPAAKAGALQKQWTERRFDAIERSLRESCSADPASFESQFDSHFRSAQTWEADQAALEQWRQEKPDSLAGALVEAIYWRAYASQLRLGAVGHLQKEAMAFYQAQLGHGMARLQQVKAQANTCPLWYSLNISLQLEGAGSRRRAASAYLDAVQAFPTDLQIHYAMSRAYSPRWGGSAVQFDQFARRAAFFTRSVEGNGMYARLYWREDGNGSEAIQFREQRGLPEWRMVKTGFEDLLQRHPQDQRSRNKFASFACRANDRETYLKLRQEMGEHVMPELWPDVASVEDCDRKLGRGHTAAASPAHAGGVNSRS